MSNDKMEKEAIIALSDTLVLFAQWLKTNANELDGKERTKAMYLALKGSGLNLAAIKSIFDLI